MASPFDGLIWKSDQNLRKYVYGLSNFKDYANSTSSEAGARDGFRRAPFFKNMAITNNGVVVKNLPISCSTSYAPSDDKIEYWHPVLDPDSGIFAAGMNIGTNGHPEPSVTAYDALPIHKNSSAQYDWVVGPKEAKAWWAYNSNGTEYLALMPDDSPTDKIYGPLWSTFSNAVHFYNGGVVDSDLVVRQLGEDYFPYFVIDPLNVAECPQLIKDKSNHVAADYSYFAVVTCVNCTVIALGAYKFASNRHDISPTGGNPVKLQTVVDSAGYNQVGFWARSHDAESIKVPKAIQNYDASTPGKTIQYIHQIHYENVGGKDVRTYFCWYPITNQGDTFHSYFGKDTGYDYYHISVPPVIFIDPNRNAGEDGEVQILQWGIEWNL